MGDPVFPKTAPKALLTTPQLEAALAAAAPGSTVAASAVAYVIRKPLKVPEGVTLEGVGEMTYDAAGRLKGIVGVATRLRADPTLQGDIVTLANDSCLRGLIIEDVLSRQGNLVVLCSTKVGDTVSALVEGCELYNPNKSFAGDEGPVGRGVVAFTRNPKLEAPPGPDEGALVALTMRRSMIRSPGGGSGVFAVNFAPHSRVFVRLDHNVIGGGLDAVGGVSRPDTVVDSDTVIFSTSNVYRADGPDPANPADPPDPDSAGWSLRGGSTPPKPTIVPTNTDSNNLVMDSVNDRIEGFGVGLYAAGGTRFFNSPIGPVSLNRAYLTLDGTVFRKSISADVVLIGAEGGFPGTPDFAPGDHNHLYVSLRRVKASGSNPDVATLDGASSLANVYEDAAKVGGGLLSFSARGVGNFLQIMGEMPFNPGPPAKVFIDK